MKARQVLLLLALSTAPGAQGGQSGAPGTATPQPYAAPQPPALPANPQRPPLLRAPPVRSNAAQRVLPQFEQRGEPRQAPARAKDRSGHSSRAH